MIESLYRLFTNLLLAVGSCLCRQYMYGTYGHVWATCRIYIVRTTSGKSEEIIITTLDLDLAAHRHANVKEYYSNVTVCN